MYAWAEDREFSLFDPPSGQQCFDYAQSYINSVGGYINNPNATSACQYCAYAKGDDFFKPLNISFDNRWRDLGIFIAFIGFNIIVVSVRYLFIMSIFIAVDMLELLDERCADYFFIFTDDRCIQALPFSEEVIVLYIAMCSHPIPYLQVQLFHHILYTFWIGHDISRKFSRFRISNLHFRLNALIFFALPFFFTRNSILSFYLFWYLKKWSRYTSA